MPLAAPMLDEASAIFFRNQLRDARAKALRDAEDFHDLLFTFERLGAYAHGGAGRGLGHYKSAILRLLASRPVEGKADLEIENLLELVREARNDALHQGASARHLAANAIRVALALEDALLAQITPQRVRHFMVTNPTCAELWQPLSVVRYSMLAHSFSYLPIKDEKSEWRLISDSALVRFLRGGDRRRRLDISVEAACKDGLVLDDAVAVNAEQLLSDVIALHRNGQPCLVLEADGVRLAGILTAYDLL